MPTINASALLFQVTEYILDFRKVNLEQSKTRVFIPTNNYTEPCGSAFGELQLCSAEGSWSSEIEEKISWLHVQFLSPTLRTVTT